MIYNKIYYKKSKKINLISIPNNSCVIPSIF